MEAKIAGVDFETVRTIAAMGANSEAARKAVYRRHGRGLMIMTGNGTLIQHPAVGIANQAMKEMIKIAGEFGMTPAARTRLSQPSKEPKQTELFDFINGGKKVG
jgi:P27 family predicted phage terminase small subunit